MSTTTQTKPAPTTKPKDDTDPPKRWNVVLIDDNDHSYEYVIAMMQKLFGHSIERGYQIAKKVDNDGRAVCLTTHKEHAELKRDQILGFGADPLMSTSKGSMTAVIEPAEFEGEHEDADGAPGDGGDNPA